MGVQWKPLTKVHLYFQKVPTTYVFYGEIKMSILFTFIEEVWFEIVNKEILFTLSRVLRTIVGVVIMLF